MRRGSSWLWILLALALVAGACGTGDDEDGTNEGGRRGGTLVLGAEQEPDCADWIGSCSGASWGYWTMTVHTLPRAFDVTSDGDYVPSVLLTGTPELDTGPPQRVTYRIAEEAVWSDGTPITSSDFRYTVEQVRDGTDIYSKTTYEDVESVDDSNPKVAVVTFKKPSAAWRDLFGPFYGVLPKHLLEGKDRSAAMKDGYTWSGWAWKIERWNKGQDVTLVPNPRFWGKKPAFNKVVFRFILDTTAELQAYKTGQVSAIYPQPQVELTSQLESLPNTTFEINTGTTYEGLWFNTDKPPLDRKAVRQALAYATDREAVVAQLIRPMKADAEVLQSFTVPNLKRFTSDPFKIYRQDLQKVDELMTGDGWVKGADGIWAKNSTKAVLEISTTAGNKGRELVEQLLQNQWRKAGFDLRINNTTAGTLIGEWLPQGRFMIGMYAQIATPDPGQCTIFCSKNIPTAASPSGQNYTRLESEAIDRPWIAADAVLDLDERAALVKEGAKALAEEVPALPLYQKLTTFVWSTAIGGPLGDNVTFGPFWNMNEWIPKS